jgi:hypothetical protein
MNDAASEQSQITAPATYSDVPMRFDCFNGG